MNDDVNSQKKQIKLSIIDSIKRKELDKGSILIEKYKSLLGNDLEAYYFKALLFIEKQRFEEAERLLKYGLQLYKNNYILYYNLGYLYEQIGEYLNALEAYERAVFNTKDREFIKSTISHINILEKNYKDNIQKQLKERKKLNKIGEKNEYEQINLHLVYDSPYCDRFIHFVNEHFNCNEHRFIILGTEKLKLEYIDLNEISNVQLLDISTELGKIIYYLNNSSRVFIHYLFDHLCELICKFDIKRPIYWGFWGGDLYNYIDIEMYDGVTKKLLQDTGLQVCNRINKNTIQYLYRKAAIRRIKYIMTINNEDYNKINENFITNSELLPFFYPIPTNFQVLNRKEYKLNSDKYNFKNKYKYVILIGNSANPSNNHIEVLYKLKNIELKDFCVIVPLSYSNQKWYTDEVIKQGKELLGERFIPLRELLCPEEYYNLLSQVDIGIFNHNRQQALGNIICLLYLGKKVYIKNNITSFKFFRSMGLNIYDINNIEKDVINNNIYLQDEEKKANMNIIEKHYGEEKCLENIKTVFDDEVFHVPKVNDYAADTIN